jgi:hypothetical protein
MVMLLIDELRAIYVISYINILSTITLTHKKM